jgi:hypothetical protein
VLLAKHNQNDKVEEDRVKRACSRNAHRILVAKPEGKRSLGVQRRRWVDNIKMNFSGRMRWYGMD